MKILQCTDCHRELWNEFVEKTDGATLYHRFEWRDVNAACFGHDSAYLAALDAGHIVGIFPIARLKSYVFGNIACSLPFLNYAGPCAASEDVLAALQNAAAEVADRWRVDYVEIRSRRYLGDRLPMSDHKVSMIIDLDPNPNKLWDAFKSEHRREIRKAAKNGFVARFGAQELVDDFFTVFSESWRDLGTPVYSKSYFESIVRTFKDSIRVCVLYAADGEPAAAAFDGLHRETVEGMWLGTRAKYRHQFAGYALYWELIKNACERGFLRFHLGRSTAQSGGETFKKKWNARTEQLYWHYLLRTRRDIPQLNVQNAKYRLAIGAWRHLPLSVSQILGPFFARSIP